MNQRAFSLLAADEPPPVSVQNASGASPLLLVADHAGVASPRALGRLGVAASEWQRHILDPNLGKLVLPPGPARRSSKASHLASGVPPNIYRLSRDFVQYMFHVCRRQIDPSK